MAQQIKVLDAKPDDLGSIPRSYRIEERTESFKLSSELHT